MSDSDHQGSPRSTRSRQNQKPRHVPSFVNKKDEVESLVMSLADKHQRDDITTHYDYGTIGLRRYAVTHQEEVDGYIEDFSKRSTRLSQDTTDRTVVTVGFSGRKKRWTLCPSSDCIPKADKRDKIVGQWKFLHLPPKGDDLIVPKCVPEAYHDVVDDCAYFAATLCPQQTYCAKHSSQQAFINRKWHEEYRHQYALTDFLVFCDNTQKVRAVWKLRNVDKKYNGGPETAEMNLITVMTHVLRELRDRNERPPVPRVPPAAIMGGQAFGPSWDQNQLVQSEEDQHQQHQQQMMGLAMTQITASYHKPMGGALMPAAAQMNSSQAVAAPTYQQYLYPQQYTPHYALQSQQQQYAVAALQQVAPYAQQSPSPTPVDGLAAPSGHHELAPQHQQQQQVAMQQVSLRSSMFLDQDGRPTLYSHSPQQAQLTVAPLQPAQQPPGGDPFSAGAGGGGSGGVVGPAVDPFSVVGGVGPVVELHGSLDGSWGEINALHGGGHVCGGSVAELSGVVQSSGAAATSAYAPPSGGGAMRGVGLQPTAGSGVCTAAVEFAQHPHNHHHSQGILESHDAAFY